MHDAINRLCEGRRRGAARGDRGRARLRARLRRGAPDDDLAAAAEGGDADARRVPHAGGPRAAGRRRPESPADAIVIAENGVGRRADAERRRDRRPGRDGRSRFVDGLGVGRHRRRRPARPAPHGRGRRPDHRRHARLSQNGNMVGRRRADRTRVRRATDALLDEMQVRRPSRDPARAASPTTSSRSSCSRSTCTTASGSSSTTARGGAR